MAHRYMGRQRRAVPNVKSAPPVGRTFIRVPVARTVYSEQELRKIARYGWRGFLMIQGEGKNETAENRSTDR